MTDKIGENDVYYTSLRPERTEIKIKGSRFIASAKSVSSKEEAISYLNDIKSEFHDARHNCFAYRIGKEGMEFRASDDGEPSGSAGKPILFTIKKYGLTDIIVVVTRYFGGTKLGVGGLARAYSDSSEETLKISKRKPIYIVNPVKIFCTYEDINAVKRLVDEYSINFQDYYADSIEINANIPASQAKRFSAELTSKTSGRAGCILSEKNINIML